MDAKLVERLEAALHRLESIIVGKTSQFIPPSQIDSSIVAFDKNVLFFLDKLSTAAEKIGAEVFHVTNVIAVAFSVQKDLLIKIKHTKKPEMEGLTEFLKPLSSVIMKANDLAEKRRSVHFNHVKAAADSLSALAWIAYTGKNCGISMPVAHIEECWEMAEFYNNKILVEYRAKDLNHVSWAGALKELYLVRLKDYVKDFFPLGPTWGDVGKEPATSLLIASSPAPPPPPPSSPPLSFFNFEPSASSESSKKQGMSAVFHEINSGKSVTSGLRKVTDGMKSKNRVDRLGVVSASKKDVQTTQSFSNEGPPKLELQMGRKWVVENHVGDKKLLIDDCDSKQSIYIFGCRDSVLVIKGKVNNITVDKCSKMGVVFEDVVAACEIVNCNCVEVQCQGSAPTISVDNSGGCQLYLSKVALATSITTAKSSEVNVLIPGGADADGEWEEHALPQQFVHVFKEGQFVTAPLSHSGG